MPQQTPDKYTDPAPISCPTLANLKLQRGPSDLSGARAALLGNAAIYDQAALHYWWDHDSTTAGNDTTVVAPTGVTTGRWVKV